MRKPPMRRAFLIPYLLLALPSLSCAQATDPLGDPAAANAAYQAQDWTKATPLYEALAQGHPDSGRNWYRLGVCLHGVGRNDKALAAFQKHRRWAPQRRTSNTAWRKSTPPWERRVTPWNIWPRQ